MKFRETTVYEPTSDLQKRCKGKTLLRRFVYSMFCKYCGERLKDFISYELCLSIKHKKVPYGPANISLPF